MTTSGPGKYSYLQKKTINLSASGTVAAKHNAAGTASSQEIGALSGSESNTVTSLTQVRSKPNSSVGAYKQTGIYGSDTRTATFGSANNRGAKAFQMASAYHNKNS